jgi:hypothetical protein
MTADKSRCPGYECLQTANLPMRRMMTAQF